jgi:ABC-type uncharacterized transport system permease subunit
VSRIIRIAILSITLTAFVVLALYGFAIWVFIPLLPAGLIFGFSLYLERQQAHKARPAAENEPDHRKAA